MLMDVQWFKARQKAKGLTSFDLGSLIGRDRTAISRILSGKQRMTLEQAGIFAAAFGVPFTEVAEKAGLKLIDEKPASTPTLPGFGETDATPFVARKQETGEIDANDAIARALGGGRPGIDVWQVSTSSMVLAGVLPGDLFLLDMLQADRARAGDLVIAQVYDRAGTAMTVLRRYEPPVLVAAGTAPEDQRVHLVDGEFVAIRGKVLALWRPMKSRTV